MARSVQDIHNLILSGVSADANLVDLNSPSQVAIYRLWSYITAVNLNIHEQMWDIFQEELELIADSAASGNASWLQNQVLNFQYGDVIQLDSNFSPYYPLIDESKKIITQCSVTENSNRTVTVKVAKGTTGSLEPLTTTELDALNSYLEKIKFAGTNVVTVSQNPDRIYINADIYFDGQYIENTVKAAVKEAINSFLNNLPFDGTIYKQKLEAAILDVDGVTDIVINELKGREYNVVFGSPNQVAINRTYTLSAGYAISEDSFGNTLDDTLNMVLS